MEVVAVSLSAAALAVYYGLSGDGDDDGKGSGSKQSSSSSRQRIHLVPPLFDFEGGTDAGNVIARVLENPLERSKRYRRETIEKFFHPGSFHAFFKKSNERDEMSASGCWGERTCGSARFSHAGHFGDKGYRRHAR